MVPHPGGETVKHASLRGHMYLLVKNYIYTHYPSHYINAVLGKEIICTLYINVLFGIYFYILLSKCSLRSRTAPLKTPWLSAKNRSLLNKK